MSRLASLVLLSAIVALGCLPIASAEAAPAKPAKAPARVGKPVLFKEASKDETWLFEYSWPAQANAIAPLDSLLRQRVEKSRADLRRDWEQAKKDCPRDSVTCSTQTYQESWQVVTDLPGWLSLSATIETYSGGAHGNHGFDALLWDKRVGRARDVASLFASPAALRKAIQPAFCKALDKERAQRRKDWEGELEMFNECVDPLEATVILGSSNRKTFDRIGILVPPYMAGPYVEGSYEVTLPVTAQVIAAARPEFRPGFSVKR